MPADVEEQARDEQRGQDEDERARPVRELLPHVDEESPVGRLDALRAEYDQKLAAIERELRTLRHRSRSSRRQWSLGIVVVALLVALAPLSILAANPFNDLNPGSVHNDNIDAIYNAGITTGCDPNVSYCPNDFVTREQMASFLARAAGLSSAGASALPCMAAGASGFGAASRYC